jgi:hypothetical protein
MAVAKPLKPDTKKHCKVLLSKKTDTHEKDSSYTSEPGEPPTENGTGQ